MKYIIFIVLFTLSILSFSQIEKGYAAVKNLAEVEQKLNQHSKTLNTIYSDFKQEKHLAYLNDVIVSEGKFWFQKENSLRWEYQTPFEYIIVIKDGKFTIKDGKDVSEFDVNSNKAFQEVNNMIISSVKGSLLEEGKFNVTALENAKSYLIKLEPKSEDMAKVLKRIELYFNISDLNIYKVKMIENEEDYTIISFENKKINEAIPSGTFTVN